MNVLHSSWLLHIHSVNLLSMSTLITPETKPILCCVESLGCLGNSVLPLGNELHSVRVNTAFMQVNEITVTPMSRRLYFYDGLNRNPANIQAQDCYNPTANRAIAVFLSNARVDLGEDVGGAHPLT